MYSFTFLPTITHKHGKNLHGSEFAFTRVHDDSFD